MAGYDWFHQVDAKWLEARRDCITATEIQKLVSPYKRRSKKDAEAGRIIPAFAALWGDKNSSWPIDPDSFGAAARGHVMEPYAVEEHNRIGHDEMFHWDDCVIVNGSVGFSPDAMDVPQDGIDAVKIDVKDMPGEVRRILEVKSFEPAGHMKAIATPKMERDQLMQLAVAFHVLPSLEEAVLVFFCPPCRIPIYEETYTRDDLKELIGLVGDIDREYRRTEREMVKLARKCPGTIVNEEQVWHEHAVARGLIG